MTTENDSKWRKLGFEKHSLGCILKTIQPNFIFDQYKNSMCSKAWNKPRSWRNVFEWVGGILLNLEYIGSCLIILQGCIFLFVSESCKNPLGKILWNKTLI